jgi:hypothetical protein
MPQKTRRTKGLSNFKTISNINGTGKFQINLAYKSQQKIFDVLSDGNWHRKKEIIQKTDLTKHVVTKHLNAMKQNNIIIRRENKKSGKYPIPIEFKATQELMEFINHQLDDDEWIREIEQKTGMQISQEAVDKYSEILLKESAETKIK